MGHALVKEKVFNHQRMPWHIDDDHLIESGCFGITREVEEHADREATHDGRGLVSGFQHNFDAGPSRTDTTTTVHTREDLPAEAS
jgi:hypothetical protein